MTVWPNAPSVRLSSWMPAAPNTENHTTENRLGPLITPMMNSRMVHPLEKRAMNAPT